MQKFIYIYWKFCENNRNLFVIVLYESKYSRMVPVKFVEDSVKKICAWADHITSVFHKFYLVCSSILCLICSGAKQYYLFNISSINMKWNSKQSPVLLRNSYYETSEEPQIIPKFCFLKLYNTDPITFLQFSKFSEQHPLN